MNLESPLKFFRDQFKNPDLYEGGRPEAAEIGRMLADDQQLKEEEYGLDKESAAAGDEKKIEILSPNSKAFIKTVDIIRSSGLKPEFADDAAENKVIEERKEAILNMLRRILEDVRNYLSGISYQLMQQKSEEVDQEKFLSDTVNAETDRKRYHNKLISDIKIAARLINVTFNADFPDDLRLQEEAKFPVREKMSREELGRKLAEREYQKFPYAAGGFIDFQSMPRDEYAQRKYIACWAMGVYSDLSVIEEKSLKQDFRQSDKEAA